MKFVGEGRGDYDVVQEGSWWRRHGSDMLWALLHEQEHLFYTPNLLRCLCWTCCVCLLISLLIAAITASRQFYQHAMDAGMPRHSLEIALAEDDRSHRLCHRQGVRGSGVGPVAVAGPRTDGGGGGSGSVQQQAGREHGETCAPTKRPFGVDCSAF